MRPDGRPVETLSAPNRSVRRPALSPPRPRRPRGLAARCPRQRRGRHRIAAIVPCGHGGSGVLVGDDGPVMPMIDYEQPLPPDVDAAYRAAADSFRERGSGMLLGVGASARQLFWMEQRMARGARAGRRLSAHPAILGLAAVRRARRRGDERRGAVAPLVGRRSAPPQHRRAPRLGAADPADGAGLGDPRPDPARRRGADRPGSGDAGALRHPRLLGELLPLPGRRPHRLHRRLDRHLDRGADRPDRGRRFRQSSCPGGRCNADVTGRAGAGDARRWAAASSPRSPAAPKARPTGDALARLVASGTMALPFFGDDDGLFPGQGAARPHRRAAGRGSQRALHAGRPLCRTADRRDPRRAAAGARPSCSTAASSAIRSTARMVQALVPATRGAGQPRQRRASPPAPRCSRATKPASRPAALELARPNAASFPTSPPTAPPGASASALETLT